MMEGAGGLGKKFICKTFPVLMGGGGGKVGPGGGGKLYSGFLGGLTKRMGLPPRLSMAKIVVLPVRKHDSK